jgi:hypothetical protein
MGADFRYMKCPRQTWFLVYTIPPELRGHARFMTANGRPMDKITESLGTRDPDKARENRNQRIAYWDRQFRILRDGPSEDDIREEAIEVYRAALKAKASDDAEIEAEKRAGRYPSDEELNAEYLEALDEALDWTIGTEIDDYCERIGISSKRGTEFYRKIGIDFSRPKLWPATRQHICRCRMVVA